MKVISENLKNILLIVFKAAIRVVSFYTSTTFFLILILNEAYKGDKDVVLEEKFTSIQERIEILPELIVQSLSLSAVKKAENAFH